jgi:Ca2+/H+ antiporter
MLLRLLLVTSIACVTNDDRHRFQKRGIAISLSKHLGIAITGLLIPTALSMVTAPDATDVVKQSRGVCVVLICLYGLYLYSEWSEFSLLGLQSSDDKKKRGKGLVITEGHLAVALAVIGGTMAAHGRPHVERKPPPPPPPEERGRDELINTEAGSEVKEEGERELQLHFLVSVAMLLVSMCVSGSLSSHAISTKYLNRLYYFPIAFWKVADDYDLSVGALLGLHIQFISDSVQGIAQERGLSEEFIGLILLPMLGVDSTLLHLDNRYDSEAATQATFGLGLQTILFMTPLLVFASWIADIEGMDLLFSSFEVTVLFPAVLVVQASIEENDKGWWVLVWGQ